MAKVTIPHSHSPLTSSYLGPSRAFIIEFPPLLNNFPKRILILLLLIATVLCAVSLIAVVLSLQPDAPAFTQRDFFDKVLKRIDVNLEATLPAWFSASMLVMCALVSGLVVATNTLPVISNRLRWFGLVVIFLAMSADEVAALHDAANEPLKAIFNTTGALRHSWVLLGIVFLVLLGFLYARFMLALPSRTRNTLLAGFAIFFAGAVGMEMLGGVYANTDGMNKTVEAVILHIEEFFEMAGAATILYALLNYLAGLTVSNNAPAAA
jgi:hypothetical protein